MRHEALKELVEFLPAERLPATGPETLATNSFLRYWKGQAAFLKDCLYPRPAHLVLLSSHLHYIRIPRAASTSLSYALLSAKYPRLANHVLSPSQINFLIDANLETDVGRHPDDLYFTVVRNPLSRLVSVYRQFFECCKSDFIYADYLFGIFRKEMSFAEFVSVVHDIPDPLKDQHFRPQYELLEAYRQRDISVNVFRLEEPLRLQNFLHRFGLTADPMNQSHQAYEYREYYDEQTLSLASDVYRSDIRLFGYEQIQQDLRSGVSRKKSQT